MIDISSLKILLVEDNTINRLIAKELLSDEVAQIDEAVNGKEAIKLLLEHENDYYALILMDIQMPQMNGYEATEAIRAMEDERLSNIPIIAMTANVEEEDKSAASKVGMDAHIAKPIDIDILLDTIQNVINKRSN